jgi:hypothetical protein
MFETEGLWPELHSVVLSDANADDIRWLLDSRLTAVWHYTDSRRLNDNKE